MYAMGLAVCKLLGVESKRRGRAMKVITGGNHHEWKRGKKMKELWQKLVKIGNEINQRRAQHKATRKKKSNLAEIRE